jgi:hypothetical protein
MKSTSECRASMKRFLFSLTVALAGYGGTDSWTPLGPDGASVGILVADLRNPGTLYAGTGYGADCIKPRTSNPSTLYAGGAGVYTMTTASEIRPR